MRIFVFGTGGRARKVCRRVVGRDAIVDIGARIDHDCRIGAFSHIGPGATLPPRTRTEDGQHVG